MRRSELTVWFCGRWTTADLERSNRPSSPFCVTSVAGVCRTQPGANQLPPLGLDLSWHVANLLTANGLSSSGRTLTCDNSSISPHRQSRILHMSACRTITAAVRDEYSVTSACFSVCHFVYACLFDLEWDNKCWPLLVEYSWLLCWEATPSGQHRSPLTIRMQTCRHPWQSKPTYIITSDVGWWHSATLFEMESNQRI